MKIVIAAGASKTGKQIVMEELTKELYGGTVVIEVGHRGANKTPIEQQIVITDFAAIEERVLASMQSEVYRQPLEKLIRPYQQRIIDAVAAVYHEATPGPIKSKAKGPRNRWGGVK